VLQTTVIPVTHDLRNDIQVYWWRFIYQ
jgi:hypothetical protein